MPKIAPRNEGEAAMADLANVIVDLSHHNIINSWDSLKQDGIIAVIHKSTEGTVFNDDTYQTRRKAAKKAGLLWGAYHFTSGESPQKQVEFFLSNTKPDKDELIAVDFEPSSPGTSDMTLDQLIKFIELTENSLGRVPVVYGGHLLRQVLGKKKNATLARCPLWYARYASSAIGVPNTWSQPTIWQYTDGKFGDDPKGVAGVKGHVDRDKYFGTADQLRQLWPLT